MGKRHPAVPFFLHCYNNTSCIGGIKGTIIPLVTKQTWKKTRAPTNLQWTLAQYCSTDCVTSFIWRFLGTPIICKKLLRKSVELAEDFEEAALCFSCPGEQQREDTSWFWQDYTPASRVTLKHSALQSFLACSGAEACRLQPLYGLVPGI